MIRKALEKKLRKELEDEFRTKLKSITEQEIKREIALVEAMKNVANAWLFFKNTNRVPKQANYDYEFILRNPSRKEYASRKDFKREIIALSLIEDLYNVVIGCRRKIRPWPYISIAISYEKERATWKMVKYAYAPIKEIIEREEKFNEVVGRLLERVSEIPAEKNIDQETKKILLNPLALIFSLSTCSPLAICENIRDLANDDWLSEIKGIASFVQTKLENMLNSLPDPNKVSHKQVIKRVVEIYESKIPGPSVLIQTLEDAAVLDHIQDCLNVECFDLQCCVKTVLGYAVVRELPDGTQGNTEKAIKNAKEFLRSES